MEKRINDKKLSRTDFIVLRDLIPTAIYFVILFMVRVVFEMVSGFHPMLYVFAPIFTAIFAAPVFMLFLAKVPKLGGVMFNAIINGILYLLMGGTYLALITWIIIGIISEVVRCIFRHKEYLANILSYGFYAMAGAASICAPFIILGEDYLTYMLEMGMSQAYVDGLSQLFLGWMFPILILVTFVVGIVSGIVGLKIFKKQFIASGILDDSDDED